MTRLQTINDLQSELEKLTKTLLELNKDTYIIKDAFANSGTVSPLSTATIEVLSFRNSSMKPVEIQMYGLTSTGDSVVPFEILDVTVMGSPQLASYQGATVSSQRGLVQFWNTSRPIDWVPFGCYAGQGLNILVRNMSESLSGKVYVHVRGYELSLDDCGTKGKDR